MRRSPSRRRGARSIWGCRKISPRRCASKSSATTSSCPPRTAARASAPSTRNANPSSRGADMAETLALGEDYTEIRAGVRRICAGFPGRYWRQLDEQQEYPEDFVAALTHSGYLAALIPENYGGAGLPLRAASVILEEIHAAGCNAAACHAQLYIMGTLLRHGSQEQKQLVLPKLAAGELRLQAFGVTEPSTGTDTTQLKTRAERRGDKYVIHGQKVWTSRALQSDLMLLLARTAPESATAQRGDGLSVFLVDIPASLGKGLEIKKLPAMINHNTTELFFDGLDVPAANRIGEEGK